MKIFAAIVAGWLLGACTFYRVWLTRCEVVQDSSGEWHVKGWLHLSNYTYTPWRELWEVKLVSFFAWIPVTLIITVREFFLTLAKGCNFLFELATPKKVKKLMHPKTFPVVKYDAAMAGALEEVEYIISND